MTAPSAPDSPVPMRVFTADDEHRLADASDEIDAFEKFILSRFTAYLGCNVVSLSPGSKARMVVVDATKADSGGYGRWRVIPDWKRTPDDAHFHLQHRMDDDRGGGVTTSGPVYLPKAWVYGETERNAEYAEYLRLRDKFAPIG